MERTMNVQLAECANEIDRLADTLDPPVVPNTTLAAFVLAEADRRGDQLALVDAMTGRKLSYSDLAAAVRAVVTGLLSRGVQAGHVLAVCAPNSIEFIVTWYAASSIGAIVTTINPASTGEEIVRLLFHSGARWLLCTAELFDEKVSAAARAAAIRETFVIGAATDEMPGAALRIAPRPRPSGGAAEQPETR